jgi:hypothetical protein
MNFTGQRGPKKSIVLPKHKKASGETRRKLAAARKRAPIHVELNWGDGK